MTQVCPITHMPSLVQRATQDCVRVRSRRQGGRQAQGRRGRAATSTRTSSIQGRAVLYTRAERARARVSAPRRAEIAGRRTGGHYAMVSPDVQVRSELWKRRGCGSFFESSVDGRRDDGRLPSRRADAHPLGEMCLRSQGLKVSAQRPSARRLSQALFFCSRLF